MINDIGLIKTDLIASTDDMGTVKEWIYDLIANHTINHEQIIEKLELVFELAKS